MRSLRALAHEFDRIPLDSLAAHRVMEESTHEIPESWPSCLSNAWPASPLFYGDWLDLIQTMRSHLAEPRSRIALISSAR